jgi:hypothetical protein
MMLSGGEVCKAIACIMRLGGDLEAEYCHMLHQEIWIEMWCGVLTTKLLSSNRVYRHRRHIYTSSEILRTDMADCRTKLAYDQQAYSLSLANRKNPRPSISQSQPTT